MTQEKKQTAVEWFIKTMASKHYDSEVWYRANADVVRQAIAMEKEQIMHAYGQGTVDEAGEILDVTKDAKQYYNEIYKGNK
jgi:hypothetical protein